MKLILALIQALVTMPVIAQDGGESTLLAAPVWSYGALTLDSGGVGGCNGASCTLSATMTSGDLLIAFVTQTSSIQTLTGATGGGGTWHVCTACHVFAPAVFNLDITILYSTDATANGSYTFTPSLGGSGVSWSASVTNIHCSGCSVYGPITFDQAGTTVTSSCTTCSLSSFASLAGQDLVVMFFYTTVTFPNNSWPAIFTLDPTTEDVLYSFGGGVPAGAYSPAINGASTAQFVSDGIAFRP
jgi:hypothetical protein